MTTNVYHLRDTLALAERQLSHVADLLSRFTSHSRSGIECAEVADKCRVALALPPQPPPTHHEWVLWTDKAPPDHVTIFVRHDSRQDLVGTRFADAAALPAWANLVGLWWRRA